jgi:hypothetical protein
MIRQLAPLVLAMLASVAQAEIIPVRSGEHQGFSRIVVPLPGLGDWVFGRVPGGYELRVERADAQFDVADIFDKIPRTRLVGATTPGAGRLYLALGCDCSGDAFELSGGRLVIDIKDDPPAPGGRFETILPEADETGAVGVPPDPIPPGQNLVALPNPVTAKETGATLQFPDDILTMPGPFFQTDEWNGAITGTAAGNNQREASLGSLGLRRYRQNEPTEPIKPDPLPLAKLKKMPESQQPSDMASGTPAKTANRDIWPADRQADMFLKKYQRGAELVTQTQTALLREFGRAATQGILEIRAPFIDRPQARHKDTLEENLNKTEPVQIKQPVNPGDSAHLKIETVLDRDNALLELKSKIRSDGQNCLPDALFDVASWGPRIPDRSPFDFLRARIVREFDKPDKQAVTDLAHRFLYLGFGVETKALLNAFDVPVENRDILVQLSEILDYGSVRSEGRLQRQISCSTDAAIWAVLADTNIPRAADIDKKAVLRTLSGWPRHLRELLGPELAMRFLDIDDIETATAVRNIIDRTLGERSAGFEILNAQIDDHQGDTTQAIQKLETVAANGGPLEAEAVADLLEAKLENGDPIRESTALLADSLSFEYRGTKIGKRLARAAIMGFSRAGKISATFDRIDAALKHGDLSGGEAIDLQFQAHLANAEMSSDAEFLSEFFRRGFDKKASSGVMKEARRAVAERLTSLGFAQAALGLYEELSPNSGNLDVTDRIILARGYLARRAPQKALDILLADHGAEIDALRATAYEMMQAFDNAAELYAQLGMRPEEESAAWRGRDFSTASKVGSGAIKRAAQIAFRAGRAQSVPESARKPPPKQLARQVNGQNDGQQTLAHGREILSDSSTTRKVIGELLGI